MISALPWETTSNRREFVAFYSGTMCSQLSVFLQFACSGCCMWLWSVAVLFAVLLQQADSRHRGHFQRFPLILGSHRTELEGCANWGVMWQTAFTTTSGAGQALSQRLNRLCCPGDVAGPGRGSWGVTSPTITFWCLELAQTMEAMPAAVNPTAVCCWRVACQRCNSRIRLVKQLLHSQVINRAELAAGFERMGSSGKEKDLLYWSCFTLSSQVDILCLVRVSI